MNLVNFSVPLALFFVAFDPLILKHFDFHLQHFLKAYVKGFIVIMEILMGDKPKTNKKYLTKHFLMDLMQL